MPKEETKTLKDAVAIGYKDGELVLGYREGTLGKDWTYVFDDGGRLKVYCLNSSSKDASIFFCNPCKTPQVCPVKESKRRDKSYLEELYSEGKSKNMHKTEIITLPNKK